MAANEKEESLEQVPDSWLWIRDTRGNGSVTVTFATIAFFVTTLAYVLSIVSKIGPLEIRPFDVAACSAYFIPVLSLYFGRKFTDAHFQTKTAIETSAQPGDGETK